MVFIPVIGIAEALFYGLASCFSFRSSEHKRKKEKKFSSTFEDILALANESPCLFLHFLSLFVCSVKANYYDFNYVTVICGS